MKENLNIAIIEQDIVWEDSTANKKKLDAYINHLSVDLIILPEMFNTGFSMNVECIAEAPYGKTFSWMKKVATKKNCAICGSIAVKENEQFYNRFYFVTPTKEYSYNKKHLFSYGAEPKYFTAGNNIVELEYLGWKIRPIICYDLRFPIWCRNNTNYDLLICVANWPSVRIDAWSTLLKARATENMAYTIGVNRIGVDGNKLSYNGNSNVFDGLGNKLNTSQKENYFKVTLSKHELEKQRRKYQFLNDQDSFKLL